MKLAKYAELHPEEEDIVDAIGFVNERIAGYSLLDEFQKSSLIDNEITAQDTQSKDEINQT